MQTEVATAAIKKTPPTPLQSHLTDYLQIIQRRKWVTFLFFLTVVTIVTIASIFTPPQYKATTQVIIEVQTSPISEMGANSPIASMMQEYFQTQYNLLQSRSLIHQVIEDLKLWELIQFDQSGKQTISPPPTISPADASTPEQMSKLADWYEERLKVTPVRGSSLVNISVIGSSPELITHLANTHARAAIGRSIKLQQSTAQKALDWLTTQLKEQKTKVEASQRSIIAYKRLKNITSLEESENIVQQELVTVNSKLTQTKSERIAKEASYRQLKDISSDDENIFSMPEIAIDPALQDLRRKLAGLKATRLKLSGKYGPKHPKMIELNSSIRQLKFELSKEIEIIRRNVKAELDRSITIEDSLSRSQENQKQMAMSLQEKAINYDVLRMQAESDQQIYDMLLKQSKEINLSSVMESSNVRIVDNAEIPRIPYRPRVFFNISAAIMLGLMLGIGLAFFIEYMDDTLKAPQDVPRRLELPLLCALPYVKQSKKESAPALTWSHHSELDSGEATISGFLNDISSNFPPSLQMGTEGSSGRVILIESTTRNEGKTTVVVNLATNLAGAGFRVLIVDCDLQKPGIHPPQSNPYATGKHRQRQSGFDLDDADSKRENGLIHAMGNVLAQKMDHGRLEQFSIDDLFFNIALKKRSGSLIVTNESHSMTAQFIDGRLFHLENLSNRTSNRLGMMLVRAGFITEKQLEDALDRNRRTKQPLGYILINNGYIGRDRLQGPLKLQMEEHLQKLFSWKNGHFIFEPGQINIYGNERISYEEDFTKSISNLGRLGGSQFVGSEILAHISPGHEENLFILPAGESSAKPIGQRNLMVLTKFIDLLKMHFDIVLMDTPPLDAAAGSAALSSLAEGIILVARANHLSVKVINEAMDKLPEDKIIGAVLNHVKTKYYNYFK